jgi:uncharacterized protein YjeT (DUF2065 family)
MEAVELAFGAIASALVAGGLGLMIWPTQMAAMTRRRTAARRPTADEILQKRILGVGLAAIGVFTLYMIASHHPCNPCWARAS